MTAHVIFEAIDGKYPATMSRAVLTGILREKLGFGGVIMSDDLGMKAVAEHFSLEEIIVRHALGMQIPSLERESQASGVMMIPVPGAGVLREVRGVDEARGLPLVEEVVITAHPDQELVPWPEGARYPGFIFARGDTPEAVEAALRAAHRRLQFVIAPD